MTRWTCQECLIRFRPAAPAQLNRAADICPVCKRRMWSEWTDHSKGGVAFCYTELPDDMAEMA